MKRIRVCSVSFNNILAISRRSILLVDVTGVPEENHRPTANHCYIFGAIYLQIHMYNISLIKLLSLKYVHVYNVKC